MNRKIDAESLAYWFFRLNGFLTTVNFVVHPEQGSEQRTDVDILGVRFPFRAELLTDSMEDEQRFRQETRRPYIVIAEVKKAGCTLNGPWTKKQDQNMSRVLSAVGAVPPAEMAAAADGLYNQGFYESEIVYLTLCCVGEKPSHQIGKDFPRVPQFSWLQVAGFIHRRFARYRDQKLSHPQWDQNGQTLWKLFLESNALEDFSRSIKRNLVSRRHIPEKPPQQHNGS